MRVENTVFISYRRTNIYHARAVHLFLVSKGYDVFLDYESIDAGSFEHIILNQIDSRAHFLIILTPSALERCVHPGDWLRREIEYAIDVKRNVIPLMFDNFDFRSAQQYMTGKLALLPQYNGLEVPMGYFQEAMERLHTRYLGKPLDTILHPVSPENQAAAVQHMQNPPAEPTVAQLKAESHFEAGFAHYETGNFVEAIESFSRAILLNPNFAEAFYRRGHAHRLQGNRRRAIEDWQQAVYLSPDDRRSSLFYSNIHRMEGDFAKALATADQAIQDNPDDPEVYKNRGDIHASQGDAESALEDYAQALRLNPEYALAYNNRGYVHAEQGNHAAAIADYTEALRINPNHAAAYNNRGIARKAAGDLEGAIADYEAALKLNPKLKPASDNLAIARRQQMQGT